MHTATPGGNRQRVWLVSNSGHLGPRKELVLGHDTLGILPFCIEGSGQDGRAKVDIDLMKSA